jgi:catechol 2,3-dioxygenase-like lactoylglutathione lyase family enzyme
MKINLASVLVDDQDKALRFYTEVLGFQKKTEVPLGEHRWLTVVSPDEPEGVELVLEPDGHPAAKGLERLKGELSSELDRRVERERWLHLGELAGPEADGGRILKPADRL